MVLYLSEMGENTSQKYLLSLDNCFNMLCENPEPGKSRFEFSGSPSSFHCGKHQIFYKKGSAGIEIIRILHDSMDFRRHIR